MAALSFPSIAQGQEITIHIYDLAFSPESILVQVGDRVTWINQSGVRHEIYFPTNPSNSGMQKIDHVLAPDRVFSIIVTQPGKYDYFCRWHGMQGTINVEKNKKDQVRL